MIKKELLLKVGGFDNTLRRVEDVDLAVRLALANCYFVGSPEILVERHMTQSGYKTADNNLIAEQHLVQKHSKFLLKRGSSITHITGRNCAICTSKRTTSNLYSPY